LHWLEPLEHGGEGVSFMFMRYHEHQPGDKEMSSSTRSFNSSIEEEADFQSSRHKPTILIFLSFFPIIQQFGLPSCAPFPFCCCCVSNCRLLLHNKSPTHAENDVPRSLEHLISFDENRVPAEETRMPPPADYPVIVPVPAFYKAFQFHFIFFLTL